MTNKATPTLAQVMGTLDEMVTAARAGDAERYRAAPARGPHQGLDEEQMTDAYQWGRRGLGPASLRLARQREVRSRTTTEATRPT